MYLSSLPQASYWTSKKCVVYGDVYDAEGSKVRHVFGAWNEAMFCGTEGEEATCIWRAGEWRLSTACTTLCTWAALASLVPSTNGVGIVNI